MKAGHDASFYERDQPRLRGGLGQGVEPCIEGALVRAEVPQAALGQKRWIPGGRRTPEARNRPRAPERRRCERSPGVDLKAPAGGRGDSGSTACVAADGTSATPRSPATLNAASTSPPSASRPSGLDGSALPLASAAGRSRATPRRRPAPPRRAGSGAERRHPLRHARRLELVGEHRLTVTVRSRAASSTGRRSGPPRRTATPRRTARSRTPPRTACASGGRSPDRPARRRARAVALGDIAWHTATRVQRPVEVRSSRSSKSEAEIAGTNRS